MGPSLSRPTNRITHASRGTMLTPGIPAQRSRFRGLVHEFLTHHLHVRRRLDADADLAPLDRHHLNGDAEARQDDGFFEAAR